MENYNTLLEAINGLRQQGYTEDFNLHPEWLECQNGAYQIGPEDFAVDQFFRFEGDSNPADESIVYAISSQRHQLKGILVNAFGIYSDPMADEMALKLNLHP